MNVFTRSHPRRSLAQTLLAPAACAGLLLLAPAPRPADAQAAAPAQMAPAETPLPIAIPPGATVQTEVDGRDRDLLGLVKGFLGGLTTAGGPAASGGNPALALFTDPQIRALLQNIHHLHVVALTPAPGTAPLDLLAFYEAPLEAAGGRRLLWTRGSPSVLVVGFDQPPSFAAVVPSADTVYVVRADGYPDMAVIGKLALARVTSVQNSGTAATRIVPLPRTPRRLVRRKPTH